MVEMLSQYKAIADLNRWNNGSGATGSTLVEMLVASIVVVVVIIIISEAGVGFRNGGIGGNGQYGGRGGFGGGAGGYGGAGGGGGYSGGGWRRMVLWRCWWRRWIIQQRFKSKQFSRKQ